MTVGSDPYEVLVEGDEYQVMWGFERNHRSVVGFYAGKTKYKGNTYLKFEVVGGALVLVDVDFFVSAEPYVRRIVV